MTIEEVLEMTNYVENVDGEDIYVLEKEMYKGIEKLRQRINSEKESYVFEMLSNDIKFIENHSNFAIAFRPVKWGDINRWIPCLVYEYEGFWRRVTIQYANCLKCNWTGIAADPTNPDLYFTMKTMFDVLKEIDKLSFCKCPKCEGQLSTKAIWLEDSEKKT